MPFSGCAHAGEWIAQHLCKLRGESNDDGLEMGATKVRDSLQVPYEAWNHLDFVFGIDAKLYVYDEVMKNMESKLPSKD